MATAEKKEKKQPGMHYLSKIFRDILAEIKKAGTLTSDAFASIMKTARSHAGGKTKSERMKADTAALIAFEQAEFAEGANPNGLMVCFYCSPDAGAMLAVPDGELPEDLHLTLAYLGDASQFSDLALGEILTSMRDQARWQPPLAGKVSGAGRFIGETEDCYHAMVDMPGLNEFRADLVRRLQSAGTPALMAHGFDPHITLAYLAQGEPTPDYDLSDIALRFDTLTVMIAGRRTDLPMLGPVAYGEGDVADLCAEGQAMRLFVEQHSFAEAPEQFNFLPRPGVYTSPRYGEITITRERNERFVSNFKAGVYQEKLPIDCEHDLAQSGAVGWILELVVNDDGSVDARPEWNDRGRELIEGDRFKYFSPAWYDSWTDPVTTNKIRDVAIGGALTTRPFFKEKSLQPLVASEGVDQLLAGESGIRDESAGGFTQIFFTTLTPKEGEPAIPATETSEGETDMTTGAATPNVTELQTQLAASQAQVAAEKARADAAEAKVAGATQATEEARTAAETITKLNERVESLEKDKREMRFKEIAKSFIGDRQGHLTMMEFIATTAEGGEESPQFKAYCEQARAAVARVKAAGLFAEAGGAGEAADANTAFARLETLAREMVTASAGKLTIEQATSQVATEHPQLYKEYLAEQRGGAGPTMAREDEEPIPVPAAAGDAAAGGAAA